MDVIKIPKNRIAVIIGKGGKIRREIQARSGVWIDIDSETGEVSLNGEKAFEPHLKLVVRDIVKAVGRGITPEKAFRLFQDGTELLLIDIRDYAGKSPKHVHRLRGRIIGSHGRTRELIEEMSGADIAIQGNTVALLGDIEDVRAAEVAVDMVLNGAEHSTAYHYLESMKKRHRKEVVRQIIYKE